MKCEWDAFMALIPGWMRQKVDELGKDRLLELRLRLGVPPELVFMSESMWLDRVVTADDIAQCVNLASRYSPWAASTLSKGYITARGGHRIGICGSYVDAGTGAIIKSPGMLCIRIARDINGISDTLAKLSGSVLILGKPGSGKTTLLRDLIRRRSESGSGAVSVVDEREELFPRWNGNFCFHAGPRTDVLSGCNKTVGITLVLRNMSPRVIAVDEITAQEDCDALVHACWCGVDLYATAHAGSLEDLYSRPVYQPIVKSRLFKNIVIMHADKTWHTERVNI